MNLRSGLLFVGPFASAALLFAACSSSPRASATSTTGSGGSGTGGGVPEAGTDDGEAGAIVDAGPSICATLSLPTRPFVATGSGPNRGDVAADFSLPLADGTTWTFSAEATGCESYVFVPDLLSISQTNTESIWDHDLPALLKASPKNAHYFFVSQKSTDALAETSTAAMQARIKALAPGGSLTAADVATWKEHLHVVSTRAQKLTSWIGKALVGWGQEGLCIDRRQRLRGLGFLSDVTRQDNSVPSGDWPFDSNLAYAANEVVYMNAQSDQLDALDAENATVVPVFTGMVLSEQGYADSPMPSAAQMAGFDTLEVEVTMACPDPTAIELNSCGAWDYIAQLFLDTPAPDAGTGTGTGGSDAGGTGGSDAGAGGGDAGTGGSDAGPPVTETELGRFITSYHRETHWVEDITPMMALLPPGGTASLHYAYAPSWNTQPTGVTLSLRFSNRKRGFSPATLTPLASGGTFNDQYNVGRAPVTVPIPADTKHADVWMIVTGHGSDANQCGEFCDSQHVFTVNGAANSWTVDFPMAGTESGCIAEQKNGMVPNQGGTWWYGRDGWCPGEQVTPHVWDVTALVTPGSTATVTYQGLFNGTTPPAGGSGNIVLSSYLVTYR